MLLLSKLQPKAGFFFLSMCGCQIGADVSFFQVKRIFVFVLESIGVWCIYSVKVDKCSGFSAFYCWDVKVKVKQER